MEYGGTKSQHNQPADDTGKGRKCKGLSIQGPQGGGVRRVWQGLRRAVFEEIPAYHRKSMV